jgi:hypothetical protein
MKFRSLTWPTRIAIALMIAPVIADVALPGIAESKGPALYAYHAVGVLQTIAVLLWIFTVVHNAQVLGRKGMLFTRWTAIGWFLIPIVNLYMPYRAIAEAWRASDPAVRGEETTWRNAAGPRDLLIWWVSVWVSIISVSTDAVVHWAGIAISVVGVVFFVRGALAMKKRQEQFSTARA